MEPGDLGKAAVRVLEQLVDVTQPDEFLDSLHEDATWTIPGSWPGISGTKDRADIERFMRRVFPAGFPRGLTVDVHSVHVDDPVAVVEFTGRAVTSKDRTYENVYCLVFQFRGDKVVAIREYMDSLYADRVLHR